MVALVERISVHNPRLYPLFSLEFGDAVVGLEREQLVETAQDLYDVGFDRLGMVTAVDRGESFVLIHRLTSRALTAAIFLKTLIPRAEPVAPSLNAIWPAANWQEREVYDMFGIVFEGHPDLRRILLPEEFEGFPLRKDYESDRIIRRPDYI
jgi:NADH-quinone oxidoreductase subunit C